MQLRSSLYYNNTELYTTIVFSILDLNLHYVYFIRHNCRDSFSIGII